MTSFLRYLFGRHHEGKTVRRRRHTNLVIEALENRWCPSSVSFLPDSHTLVIVGDPSANNIQVRSTPSEEIQVVGEGRNLGTFRGVENVVIRTGSGDDIVDVNLGATFPHLAIDLGQGDDRLTVSVGDPLEVDPPEPDRPPQIRINAGSGNDLVDVNIGGTFPHLNIALGTGNDHLSVTVADPAVGDPSEVDPPEPDRTAEIQIDAGGGNDDVDVNIGGTFPHLNIALGTGNDHLSVTVADPAVGDPAIGDPFEIQIDAGAGNDIVDVNIGGTFPHLNIDLGTGNDRLSVTVGDPSDVDPPEPDRTAEIQINAGAGDDVVVVDVLRGVRALLDIDMGSGNDVLRVVVGDPTGLDGTAG